MKIAICIGHNSKSRGVFSRFLDATEFEYNHRVADLIRNMMCDDVDVYYRYRKNGYNTEISELANRVNKKDYDLAIELHFNAFNGKSNGCEALYFHKSAKGKEYAESFCKVIEDEYESINRGAKSLNSDNQNGFGFVQRIKAPALILEPFFGDHPEAEKFINVHRYSCTVVEWIKSL